MQANLSNYREPLKDINTDLRNKQQQPTANTVWLVLWLLLFNEPER